MHKRLVVLILMGAALAALPAAIGALGLDIEAKGGAGIGLGSTDNPNITGSPLLAAGGGVGADVFFFNAGPANIGISAGAEYTYLSVHDEIAALALKEDVQYNFLYIPLALVGSIPVGPVNLVVHVGGFAGYFLSGKATNATLGGSPLPDTTFDSSNTAQWEFGLHLAAGADIPVMTGISISPAVQFDMGLTDVTNSDTPDYKDTLWSLAVMIGIKYKAM